MRLVYPLLRRVDFRGKGRLRPYLPIPSAGTETVSLPGGVRFRLDLRESLQRDLLLGLHDRLELGLVRKALERDGDFVDVGAHVGVYTITAARTLGGRGRVLAFEPNPKARAQLEENLALNRCEGVLVSACAVSDRPGQMLLHVPATPDPSFSSLEPGRFAEGEPLPVEVTTVDFEVARHGLVPRFVKIDVEGHELRVLAGMKGTLARRPLVLCEVGEGTAATAERDFAERGFRAFRVTARKLEPGLSDPRGLFSALFVPEEDLDLLGPIPSVG